MKLIASHNHFIVIVYFLSAISSLVNDNYSGRFTPITLAALGPL